MSLPRASHRLLAALAAALALGCGDGPTDPSSPPVATAESSVTQNGTVGSAVSARPTVRVRTAAGAPVAGATVAFEVTAGGGAVEGAERTTDGDGLATVGAWSLGTALGENVLTATVTVRGQALPAVTFRANAAPGPAARLAFTSQPAGASADSAMSTVRVELRDAYGHRAGGPTSVSLSARGAAGEVPLVGGDPVAAVDGVATFSGLRLTRAGAGYRLVAAASFGADTSRPFDVRAGRPVAISAASPAAQRGVAGSPVADRPAVVVRDAHGNGVPGVRVDFTVANGGGSTQDATATTDSLGRASVGRWTLGTVAGEQRLLAAVDGVPAIAFVATAAAGPAAALAFVTSPVDAVAGVPLAPRVDVALLDAYGNRVTIGATPVTLTLAGLTLGGSTTVDAANGVASFGNLVVTAARANLQLVASSSGLSSATSAPFSVRAAAPATMAVAAGDAQTAAAGTAVAVAPAVRVRDAFDNPVPGVQVAFAATGNGVVIGATVSTDSLGVAAVQRWTLATTAGANSLTAVTSGVPPATFAATGTPGAAASVAAVDGDGQTARAATPVPVAPAVRVRDVHGNAVPGVPVRFAVAAGGGAVAGESTTTDASGTARVGGWTLGPVAGANTLSASAEGVGAPATIAASATPNATIRGTVRGSDLELTAPTRAPLDAGRMATSALAATEYVPGELLVTYRASAAGVVRASDAARGRDVARAASGRVRDGLADRRARWRVLDVNPATLTARLRLDDPARLEDVAAELRRDARVLRVGRNAVIRRAAARALPLTSGDSAFVRQAWHYAMIDAPEAWTLTTGSAAVTVAVIDDGARFDHPELAGTFTTDGFDFVSAGLIPDCAGGAGFDRTGDAGGYDGDPTMPRFYLMRSGGCTTGAVAALEGHGLHVAGTIAAPGANGRGGAGVSWAARVRPIRVFGADARATEMDVAKAIQYAAGLPVDTGGGPVVQTTRAHVANMSFGAYVDAPEIRAAVQAAAGAGMLMVAAAGNEGVATPYYPAAYPEVLAVSAVGPDGRRASYSNFGASVDVAAPGGDMADGGETFGVYSTYWNFTEGRGTYAYLHGTSMAAPHVAGVAALLLAREPGLTAAALRERLVTHARDAGAPGRDDEYGAGIVSARASLARGARPARRTFVRLFDEAGAKVRETVADADGAYRFDELPNGRYRVWAGEDEEGDALAGAPGRRWGAFGGTSAPAEIVVTGAGERAASFAVGTPRGAEPNDAAAQAVELPLGGYVADSLAGVDVSDFFRVRLPAAGAFTFATDAVGGACGHALAANTVLELRDAAGTLLGAANDDVDTGLRRFCSRITRDLAAGTYYLVVRRQARPDAVSGGRYVVTAREGR